MLENIKHIFDIEKLQFVLVANTNQIKASINHCYGADVNAQNYLDKFLGFSFILPKSYLGSYINNSQKMYKIGLEGSSILSGTILSNGTVVEFANNLIEVNNLTLRQVETYIKHLEIYQIVSGNELLESHSDYNMTLTLFSIFISCFKSGSTNDLDNGIVDVIKLSKILGKNILFTISDNNANGRISNEDIIVTNIFCKATKNRSAFGSFEDNQEELWGYKIKSNSIKFIIDSINKLKLGEVNPV